MKRMVICALVVLSGASIVPADDEQAACLRSAFDAHLEAKMKLFDAAGPLMSFEARIMRRRLNETYCLASTECELKDGPADARALMAGALFSSCLRKEEAE